MIAEMKAGDKLLSFFILRKKEIRTKRETSEIYLSLELGDASGRVTATLWHDAQATYESLERGDVVKIKGTVITFKDRLHLSLDKVRQATDEDEVDMAVLVPASDIDLKTLTARLEKLISCVNNEHLSQLLRLVFDDPTIRTAFEHAPGGKLWHHNYLRGLLEHTLAVTTIADRIGHLYPGVNQDLLCSAALLHDIGKINSYRCDTLIDYTDEGRLLGHIVIGSHIIRDKIMQVSGFPEELSKQLLHLVLSHQGKLEQASPVVPMMLEGLILYYADELDSKANAFLRVKKKNRGSSWSSYVNLLGQFFYFGPDEN